MQYNTSYICNIFRYFCNTFYNTVNKLLTLEKALKVRSVLPSVLLLVFMFFGLFLVYVFFGYTPSRGVGRR